MNEADTATDTFVLYRIIGNDLWPRHRLGQSVENVRFILENEAELTRCAKRWIVNRIFEPECEQEIVSLLDSHGQVYDRIPFELAEYSRIGWDLDWLPMPGFLHSQQFDQMTEQDQRRAEQRTRRLKVNYVMNVNGARNFAVRQGRRLARWTLPWDGNCFLSRDAWRTLRTAVQADVKYLSVPMARLTDNRQALDGSGAAYATEEPQLVFRADAVEEFDERYPYGWRNKLELLRRLGIPGRWDRWNRRPWDLSESPRSNEAGQFVTAGWVARLDSGHPQLERGPEALHWRGDARSAAIIATIDHLDQRILRPALDNDDLMAYRRAALDQLRLAGPEDLLFPVLQLLCEEAETIVARGLWSGVFDSSRKLGPTHSDVGDLFRDVTICALALAATSEKKYGQHCADLFRLLFLDTSTRINPNRSLARKGANCFEILEMRDLYCVLDAARLVEKEGWLEGGDLHDLREWLVGYRDWLVFSNAGRRELVMSGVRGILYDMQLAAIAAFLGDATTLSSIFRRFQERVFTNFGTNGEVLTEVASVRPAHDSCCTLQGWTALAVLASRCGVDLWDFETRDGRSLHRAVDATLAGMASPEEKFDTGRLGPLRMIRDEYCGDDVSQEALILRFADAERARFPISDGIRPYWFL